MTETTNFASLQPRHYCIFGRKTWQSRQRSREKNPRQDRRRDRMPPAATSDNVRRLFRGRPEAEPPSSFCKNTRRSHQSGNRKCANFSRRASLASPIPRGGIPPPMCPVLLGSLHYSTSTDAHAVLDHSNRKGAFHRLSMAPYSSLQSG